MNYVHARTLIAGYGSPIGLGVLNNSLTDARKVCSSSRCSGTSRQLRCDIAPGTYVVGLVRGLNQFTCVPGSRGDARNRRHWHRQSSKLIYICLICNLNYKPKKEYIMRRDLFGPDHEAFRTMFRSFLANKVTPRFDAWEKQGHVDRDLYTELGQIGCLGILVPSEYGGAGEVSFKYQAVMVEEVNRAGVGLGTTMLHSGVVIPYIVSLASEEQKQRWLPSMVSGELMSAIAMTEPGTGSDLAGIRTIARRDGDEYVISGQKTFITGGFLADLVLVVCRTEKATEQDRRGGLSIVVVETNRPGFSVGRRLEKIGMKSSDTAELSFDEVRVPVGNLLGEEGEGFTYLTSNLPQERLNIALVAVASAEKAVQLAVDYAKERKAFGTPIAEFQNTKFVLAECATEVEAARTMADRALALHDEGALDGADAAKAKLFCTEVAGRVIDKCFQIHGGYGYMLEYPIARLYADTRVSRVYGGTSEIMKTIVARQLGL